MFISCLKNTNVRIVELELLLKDWYIARHEREELYREILVIDEKKQDERHPD